MHYTFRKKVPLSSNHYHFSLFPNFSQQFPEGLCWYRYIITGGTVTPEAEKLNITVKFAFAIHTFLVPFLAKPLNSLNTRGN